MRATLVCPYCQMPAELALASDHLYGRDFGPVWECRPCEAWVGVHPGTTKPLGTLANAKLRKARRRAHEAFDPLWQAQLRRKPIQRWEARRNWYQWLSHKLNIPFDDCHIGMMGIEDCQRVVTECLRKRRNLRIAA